MEALRERFGKYHVLEKIAQGGMAEVYKVKTVGIAGFEKVQALKRILPSSAREARFIRSFIDEARIAVELTHRNIVQVFDFGKADGELYMAMELIEGKDLRSAVALATAHELPVPIPVAAYLIAEVAAGLDFAHRRTDVHGRSLGIVHCDVSPSNVMLSSDGYVKILDFGIARASFASALERRRLRGKPRYMAPEQTTGEPPTAAADVFALGIVAWELLTGLPLFKGPNLKAILSAVRTTIPPRVDRLNPQVPREMADAIEIALRRDPAQRGTAADLGAACARTALLAGARGLAAWLAEVDTRPSRTDLPWPPVMTPSPVPKRSMSIPAAALPPARPSALTPGLEPTRPTARSLTASLASGSPFGDLGDGTPGFLSSAERTSSSTALQRFAGLLREGTATRQSAYALLEPITRTSAPSLSATAQRYIDPTAITAARWGHEGTVSGIGRLADALPEPGEAFAPGRDSTASHLLRPSYDTLQLAPGARPSALRFDDEVTNHSLAFAGPDPDDTSHDPIAALALGAPPEDDDADVLASTGWAPPSSPAPELLAPDLVADALLGDELEPTRVPIAPSGLPDELAGPAARPTESLDDDALLADDREDAPAGDRIDDELALAPDGPVGTRRAVVIAALLGGAAAAVLRPVARSLAELAYQRGGVVLAQDDVELLVAFGLEIAGEDDVASAIDWALAATALVREASADPGTGLHALAGPRDRGALELRLGARAGVPVAPGAAIPADAFDEARTLAAEAQAGRPLLAGHLASGAGRFALREIAAPAPLPRGARVVEVLGAQARDATARRPLPALGRDAFVGRAAELGALGEWFAHARALERRIAVVVTGAAGVGKSRLVAELGRQLAAAAPGLRVVASAARPAHQLAPFALAIDLYQAALGLPPGHGRAARRDLASRLAEVLRRGGLPLARARDIAVDLERAMELRDGGAIAAPELADLRPRVAAGLATLREITADRARPQLTILEDLHAADRASLEVLRHVLAVPVAGAELLVLTARDAPDGPGLPALPVDATLALPDLAAAELRALAADRLGPAASAYNIAAVLARAGGNPLQVEELARAVRESGGEVPSSAREVVGRRIERLSARALAALRLAALLGPLVRVRLLDELLGDQARLGEEGLAAALDELVAGGFLERLPGGPGAEPDLGFPRELVREVVEASLSARARRENHARIGRLLASRFFAGREEPPAVIADHLERGGEVAGAAAFWLRAGRLALGASDAAAAIACFSRTLELEAQLGAAAPSPTSRARRREALAGRDDALRLHGELPHDLRDLDELEQLCEGEAARLADVELRRAHRLLAWGDHAGASSATALAEEHGARAADDRLRGEALRIRAEILERLGRFEEALIVVGQAEALFHHAGALADEMAAMIGRGRIYLLRAQYQIAREAYRPVLALVAKTGDPWLERIATAHVAVIEMCLGDFEAAMASARRSLELCRRYGDRAREGDALSVAGIVLLEVGLHEEAAATFGEALALLARAGTRWSHADCQIYAGVCEVRRGGPHGLAYLDAALAAARELGARYLEANALIARAGAHLAAGELEAAADDARDGARAASEATLVGYEIQGLARHALALARLGRGGEASVLVQRALALFEYQPVLEGSEEEVLVGCAEVLAAAGAHERAAAVRARGRASARRKLDALTDPAWRAAYAALPEIRALLDAAR